MEIFISAMDEGFLYLGINNFYMNQQNKTEPILIYLEQKLSPVVQKSTTEYKDNQVIISSQGQSIVKISFVVDESGHFKTVTIYTIDPIVLDFINKGGLKVQYEDIPESYILAHDLKVGTFFIKDTEYTEPLIDFGSMSNVEIDLLFAEMYPVTPQRVKQIEANGNIWTPENPYGIDKID